MYASPILIFMLKLLFALLYLVITMGPNLNLDDISFTGTQGPFI